VKQKIHEKHCDDVILQDLNGCFVRIKGKNNRIYIECDVSVVSIIGTTNLVEVEGKNNIIKDSRNGLRSENR